MPFLRSTVEEKPKLAQLAHFDLLPTKWPFRRGADRSPSYAVLFLPVWASPLQPTCFSYPAWAPWLHSAFCRLAPSSGPLVFPGPHWPGWGMGGGGVGVK